MIDIELVSVVHGHGGKGARRDALLLGLDHHLASRKQNSRTTPSTERSDKLAFDACIMMRHEKGVCSIRTTGRATICGVFGQHGVFTQGLRPSRYILTCRNG